MDLEPSAVFVFKPDGIGDFVLITGCLRTIAKEIGEENLFLCVRTPLVELARAQFPRATILDLPVAGKRRVLNLFAANLLRARPVIRQLRQTPFAAALCFRHMRSYLQSLIFYSANAKRFLVAENLLARSRRLPRVTVEHLVRLTRRPEILPYPAPSENLPTELAANAALTGRLLGRTLTPDERLPTLTATPARGDRPWVLCPASSSPSKDYPPEKWVDVFRSLAAERAEHPLLIVGEAGQSETLTHLASTLTQSSIAGVSVVTPPSLVDFANLLASAGCVFAVDTAAVHIATALDRPLVVVFSGLHVGMFGPWQRSSRQQWIPPAPQGPKRSNWTKRLAPSMITSAARSVLASSR